MATKFKVFISDKEVVLSDQQKQAVTDLFPALNDGGSVIVRVANTYATKNIETNAVSSNPVKSIMLSNTVPVDKNNNVVQDVTNGSPAEFRLSTAQKKDTRIAGKIIYNEKTFAINGIMQLTKEDLNFLYFLAFVSGEIKNNQCPQGYKNIRDKAEIYFPEKEAKASNALTRLQVKASGIIHETLSENTLRQICTEALGMEGAMKTDIEIIRENLDDKMWEDATGSFAKTIIELQEKQDENDPKDDEPKDDDIESLVIKALSENKLVLSGDKVLLNNREVVAGANESNIVPMVVNELKEKPVVLAMFKKALE